MNFSGREHLQSQGLNLALLGMQIPDLRTIRFSSGRRSVSVGQGLDKLRLAMIWPALPIMRVSSLRFR